MTRPKPITRSSAAKSRGGRARGADRAALNERILAAAGELFLEHGFEATSMDTIAVRAGISKRTLYSRHRDKSALFNAVIYDLLGRFLAPTEKFQDDQPGGLKSALLRLARDMIERTSDPELLAAYRVISFEMQRRPEFATWLLAVRNKPAFEFIARTLERYRDELRIDVESAAEQFFNLTFDSSLRLASFGVAFSPRAIEERIGAAVDLFLSGARRRSLEDAGRVGSDKGEVATLRAEIARSN
jgi:AcrR family transcriptional regulator